MKLSQLQQTHSVKLRTSSEKTTVDTPPDNSYYQLYDMFADIPETGMNAMKQFAELFGFEWDSKISSYAQFPARFSTDFQILATDAAKAAKDMRGMTIVFGENHEDFPTLRMIAEATHSILEGKEDIKIFIEGEKDHFCENRLWSFSLGIKNCDILERGSKYLARLDKLQAESLEKAKVCAAVVCRDLGLELGEKLKASPWPSDYAKFVNEHYKSVSEDARLHLAYFIQEYNEAKNKWDEAQEKFMPKRDRHMASGIRQNRTIEGVNIVMVGARHSKGLFEILKDLPCIFMTPHQVVAQFPRASLVNQTEPPTQPKAEFD